MAEPSPTVWASVGGTFRTRDYENIKIDVGLAGVPVGCSEEVLQELLLGANVTLQRLVDALATELAREVESHVGQRQP